MKAMETKMLNLKNNDLVKDENGKVWRVSGTPRLQKVQVGVVDPSLPKSQQWARLLPVKKLTKV